MNLPKEKQLPIWQQEQAIIQGLEQGQVVIVSAETGAGKSTQIPQMLWKNSLHHLAGRKKLIGITQPRRLAAVSVAKRVSEEMGCQLGNEVGYQVRFEDELSSLTEIKFATEGIFLQEAKSDPLFSRYSVIMLDEAHERTIEMDMLLGLIKLALKKRDDLKVVIASATINPETFYEFFDKEAVIIKCKGRVFPLEKHFEEKDPSESFIDYRAAKMWNKEVFEMPEFAAQEIAKLLSRGCQNDILVFLSGYDTIQRAKNKLEKYCSENHWSVDILIAHGQMPLEELQKILNPNGKQRIILATNVAETSITIPGKLLVIDTGLVKKDFYNSRNGIVEIEEIVTSQASSEQRGGRSARISAGEVYYLFTKEDFERRQKYDTPAIQRSSLESVVLLLASIGIENPSGFPFISSPKQEQINKALTELKKIGALSEAGGITNYGEQLMKFPLMPQIAHLLLKAAENDALKEMATFLAMYQARPIPIIKNDQKQEPEYKILIRDCQSDLEVLLVLWQAYRENGFDWNWAKDMGIKPRAMMEARDIRGQLLEIASKCELRPSSAECDFSKLKAALLTAVPQQVFMKSGNYGYHNLDRFGSEYFYIHPSSLLCGETPELVFSFETRQTNKRFMLGNVPVTVEDMIRFCPVVTIVYKESKWSMNNTGKIYENVMFGRMCLRQSTFFEILYPESKRYENIDRELSLEEVQKVKAKHEEILKQNEMKAGLAQELLGQIPVTNHGMPWEIHSLDRQIRLKLTPSGISFDSDLDFLKRDLPEELTGIYTFDETEIKEMIREMETEIFQFNQYQNQIRDLKKEAEDFLESLPKVSDGFPDDINEEIKNIKHLLQPMFSENYPSDLQKAKEKIPHLLAMITNFEERQKELQKLNQTCQEELAEYVEAFLQQCPLCTAIIDGSCNCALYLNDTDKYKNGEITNLIALSDQDGKILARIYLESRKGIRRVVREIKDVCAPITKIEVYEHPELE